ncbi:signal peptidase II [Prochlorococcus marinus]|uniref:signal peptidase II n=1 Tax=Prochlorococcus marinus TaxID=1219 RepID=UPI0022B4EEAC|nr:signal peptidase II [Prochlorococcus marinus]
MNKIYINRIIFFVITISIVIIDQVTKNIAITINYQDQISIIPNIIQFNLVKNTGAAFSILNEFPIFLAIMSLIVAIAIIVFFAKNPNISTSTCLTISFLLGGTIGNGIDRLSLGYVIDFIQLIPINFPIFNIADISINIAFFILITNNLSSSIHLQRLKDVFIKSSRNFFN